MIQDGGLLKKTLGRLAVIAMIVSAGCTKQPQQVRHLHESQEPDSATMAQLRFNMHMADAADQACIKEVRKDSLQYAQDDFGFWYAKVVSHPSDTIEKGEEVALHLILSELDGKVIADVKDRFVAGSGDLPNAINRSLRQMCRGEEMMIIAPWYAAYGVEGTTLVKPYTNLRIDLKVIDE